jgi:hypothetical protein
MYLCVPIIIYCVFKVTMDSAPQVEAQDVMGTATEPLKQEKAVESSHETSTEGEKLRQYLAAIFGKHQGCSAGLFASLILLRELVCTVSCYISLAILQL